MKIKYGKDNIFDCLPDNITTVNVILDSANFGLDEFDEKTESAVKKLNKQHFDNDDFFDVSTNQVISQNDIYKKYNLEIVL